MDGRGIDHGYKHFNMKNVVGFIADHQYCQSIIPPINLALNSDSLGRLILLIMDTTMGYLVDNT